MLRCTLCYRGEIMSGSITVQALVGQLSQVGECSVMRYVCMKDVCASIIYLSIYYRKSYTKYNKLQVQHKHQMQ